MADFTDFSSSSLGPTPAVGKANTSMVMEQVKQQIAVANAQELLSKMSDKCFKKCVFKPGSSLDNSEQKCIAMCMDRYMEAWNLVSQQYTNRLNNEHGGRGGGML